MSHRPVMTGYKGTGENLGMTEVRCSCGEQFALAKGTHDMENLWAHIWNSGYIVGRREAADLAFSRLEHHFDGTFAEWYEETFG